MKSWREALTLGAASLALLLLCTALPYLPGRYDSLAAPVSVLALLFGRVGGGLALAACFWVSFPAARSARLIVLAAAWFLFIGMSFGALLSSGPVFCLAVLAVGVPAMRPVRIWLRNPNEQANRVAACFLVLTPLSAGLLQWALMDSLASSARDRAMRNSAPLIRRIEEYHERRGEYPLSLVSLWQDHPPGVIGVREYRYERSGEAYSLSFELPSFVFGTREVVMFNPRDEHLTFSHDTDRLEFEGDRLRSRQGFNRASAAGPRHWMVFEFD